METKRCPRCNKLLRVDAESCSRCGIVIPTGKSGKNLVMGRTDATRIQSRPTNPPASPHRAGHYSGLHPEDQPFQSSFFLRVQRSDAVEVSPAPVEEKEEPLAVVDIEEPAEVWEPEAVWEQETRPPEVDMPGGETDSRPAVKEYQTLWHEDAPQVAPESHAGLDEEIRKLAASQTFYPTSGELDSQVSRPALRRNPQLVPLLITASLISFLVASGLLTFLLIGKSPAHSAGPQMVAMPGELRVGDMLQLTGDGLHAHSVVTLTRDGSTRLLDSRGLPAVASTDSIGKFQVSIPITSAWKVGIHNLLALDAAKGSVSTTITIQPPVAGPPQLSMETTRLDLGAGSTGSITQKNLTMTNTGGGELSWQAKSNSAWLSLSPAKGTFAGKALVTLTVDRTNLVPRAYLGQVAFSQRQGGVQVLYVSMTVTTTPANLVVSTAALTFVGTPLQSPATQTIVVQNNGGEVLSWTVGSATSDGLNWLSISPDNGLLDPNTSAILTVSLNTIKMLPGAYQGMLNFSYADGPQQQVLVTLTVNPPPAPVIQVSPGSLNFTSNQGYNPPAQTFTLTDSGKGPLNWAIQKDQTGQVLLNVAPLSGSLAPGQSVSVSVVPVPGNISGTLNSTLSVIDSDPGNSVASQQVKVTLAITSQAIINLLTGNLAFNHSSTTADTSAFIIFSNIGSVALNWELSIDTPVSWLSFDTKSGALTPGEFAFVTVRCVSTQIKVGTYTVTVTLRDTDAATVVAPRTFTVTLVVS